MQFTVISTSLSIYGHPAVVDGELVFVGLILGWRHKLISSSKLSLHVANLKHVFGQTSNLTLKLQLIFPFLIG